jgi:hypothetical protein
MDTWVLPPPKVSNEWNCAPDRVHGFPDFEIPFQIVHSGLLFAIRGITDGGAARKMEVRLGSSRRATGQTGR